MIVVTNNINGSLDILISGNSISLFHTEKNVVKICIRK